jgi:serine/threonine-protein kinase HipA
MIKIPENINKLTVLAGGSPSGELSKQSNFSFTYGKGGSQISKSMPYRVETFTSGALHPIFEMNLPEGYVRYHITEKLMKHTKVNDLTFLALQKNKGIGRLSYGSSWPNIKTQKEDINAILEWDGAESIFHHLVDKHILNTSISGVQPKVLVSSNSDKGLFVDPNYIIKTGGEDFAQLAFNEFVCMSIAKNCGLDVPEFWLSKDESLFVMKRFDITPAGRLGMEDFAVLMGRRSQDKYIGSYEGASKVITHYGMDEKEKYKYFDYVSLSCILGNGDAHLKNFSVLYDDINTPATISPLYDVVCTNVYDDLDNKLALKMNKSKHFPNRSELLKFAKNINVDRAEQRIEQMADIATSTMDSMGVYQKFPALYSSLKSSISRASVVNTGFSFDGHATKARKNRKIDLLLKR